MEYAEYKYGMLPQYLEKFHWEDDEEDATEYEYSSEEDEHGNFYEYPYKPSHSSSVNHQGYGFRADAQAPPRFMGSPFWTVDQAELLYHKETFDKAIEVSINHISSKTGKVYRHVETLNIVDSPNCIFHLTFTAQKTAAKFIQKKKEKEAKKKGKKRRRKKSKRRRKKNRRRKKRLFMQPMLEM